MSGKKRTSSAHANAGGQSRNHTPQWHFRRGCALREDGGPLEEVMQHFEACVQSLNGLDAVCDGLKRSSAASSSSDSRNKRRRKGGQSGGSNTVTVSPPSSSSHAVRDIDSTPSYLLACAYTELGKIHEGEGRLKKAMECYQSAIDTSADAWLAVEAHVLMGIITRTVVGTDFEDYFRAAICAIELHDNSNESDDDDDDSDENEEAHALYELHALARFHLGLHLCQGSCRAEGDTLLSSLGFRWRLSEDILAYRHAPSPSSAAAAASAPSSAVSAALPTNLPTSSAHASHITFSPPPYVNVLDGVLSAELLEELTEVFKPDSVFWSEHAYERADTGYFSYMFDLQQQPGNAVEEAVQRIHQEVAKWRPAAAKARWGEWWAHTRRHGSWHPLHFDTDEGSLRAGQGVKTPSVSTVLYISGEVGGPTVVINQPVEGPGVTQDVDGVLVYPKANRLAIFDGRMLHGVVPSHGASPDSSARRVTFMVGFWEEAKPLDVDGGTDGAGPMRLLPQAEGALTWPSRLGGTGGWRRTLEPQPAPVITVQSAWTALPVTRTPHAPSSAAAGAPPTTSHSRADDGAEKGGGRKRRGSDRVHDGDDHLECASDACPSDSGDSDPDEEEDKGSVCASEPPLPVQITGRFVLARRREVEEEIERVDRAAVGITRAIHALVGGPSGDNSSRSTKKGSSGGGGGGSGGGDGVCRTKALKILRDWLHSHTLGGHDGEGPSFQEGIAAINRNSKKMVRALCEGLSAGGGGAHAGDRSRGRDGCGRGGGGAVGWDEAEACLGLQVINLLPGLDEGMTWLMAGGVIPVLIAQVRIPLVHSTTTTTHSPANAATTTRRHLEALKTLCHLTGEDEACAIAAVEAGAVDGLLTYMENVGAGDMEAAAAVLWNVLRARERVRQEVGKRGERDGKSDAESLCMAETRQRLIGWLQEEEDDDSRKMLCGAIAWAGEATLGDIRAIRATGVIEVLAEDGGEEELEALARLAKGQGRREVEQAVCRGIAGGKTVWKAIKQMGDVV